MIEQQSSDAPKGAPAPAGTDAHDDGLVEIPQQQSPEGEEAPSPQKPEAPAESKKDDDPVKKQLRHMSWRAHDAERRANAAVLAQQEAAQRVTMLEAERREILRRATMPTLEQHNLDPNAYQRAVDEHNQRYLAEQRELLQRRDQETRAVAQQQAIAQFIDTRIAEAQQKYADYDTVVSNPALPPLRTVNPAVFQALMESDDMADLTYFLGKNPDEAHRIADLPPAKAIIELGKIASRLPGTNQRPQSAAPPPPPTVGGNATVRKRPEDMTDAEFNAWRRAAVRRRR